MVSSNNLAKYKNRKNNMVSSKNLAKLRNLFDEFCSIKIDMYSYDSHIQDVICDIYTCETYIMGIADTIISNNSQDIEVNYLHYLYEPVTDKVPKSFIQQYKYIYPEVFEYIRKLEMIRLTCLSLKS